MRIERKSSQFLLGAIALGVVCCLGNPAQAGATLFGAATGKTRGFGESSLYTIDPDTGDPTLVGPIGFENVTGLAFLSDGRLVGSAKGPDVSGGASAILIEIDPATGVGTLIGEIDNTATGNCGRMPDLTFDPTPMINTLFGYGQNCRNVQGLNTIDQTTGAGTSVGDSGFSAGGNGLARDPRSGMLYATPDNNNSSLITIDPLTGVTSEVSGSAGNVPNRVNALDFHPTTGVLYGSLKDANSGDAAFLVTIDLLDGTTTTVGSTITGLDAIAFTPPRAAAVQVDHFLCYEARTTKGEPKFERREVDLEDQFGATEKTVKKPKFLCTPVAKSGEGVLDPATHLVCYEVKRHKGQDKFERRDVLVFNQFEDEEKGRILTVKKPRILCVPSTKEVLGVVGGDNDKNKDKDKDKDKDDDDDDDDDDD